MLGTTKLTVILILALVTSCASYHNLKPHDRVLTGASLGGITTAALVGSSPFSLPYILAGGSIVGMTVGLHELSRLQSTPRIPEDLILKKNLLEKGQGKLSYLSLDDSNSLIDWKLYQSGTWIRNRGDQFLYVDKVIEFQPSHLKELKK